MSKICNCSKCCYIRSEWMIYMGRSKLRFDLYAAMNLDIWRNPGAHRGKERE